MNTDYYKYQKYKNLYKSLIAGSNVSENRRQELMVMAQNQTGREREYLTNRLTSKSDTDFNKCHNIKKGRRESFLDWKTRCRDNPNYQCYFDNKKSKCLEMKLRNIRVNTPDGTSYQFALPRPYTVSILKHNLLQVNKITRYHLFISGQEEKLDDHDPLQDGDVVFMMIKPHVEPIMDTTTLEQLVEKWCNKYKDKSIDKEKHQILDIYGNISEWDVGNVTVMDYLFSNQHDFNDDINEWNVENVTNMVSMFLNAESFNQPLDKWVVSNVTNMESMFNGALQFNQSIDKWKVDKVTNTGFMFNGARSFNQPLDDWDVGNITYMEEMFSNCYRFNQPLESWGNKLKLNTIRHTSAGLFNNTLLDSTGRIPEWYQ